MIEELTFKNLMTAIKTINTDFTDEEVREIGKVINKAVLRIMTEHENGRGAD